MSRLETHNSMVNVKWAKRVLMDDIRANNDILANSLNELLWQRYGVLMCQSTLYKVRGKALIDIHGGHDESYTLLPRYCEMIKETNPTSTAFCAWSEPHPEKPLAFSSIFIVFRGALDGLFAGYRSLTGVDGAHLKGNYGGVLLSEVTLDGNNELFPIAWGIVPGEDQDSWKFFV